MTRISSQRSRLSIHYKMLLMERCQPILGRKTFDELDTALLSKLITELSQRSARGYLSGNTIRRIYSDLKHFLNWSVEEGYLDKMPKFPRITAENTRRPHFDDKDWRKLTRHLREFVKVDNAATLRARTMLVYYVLILANTGVRVGEARTLKWRDVRQVDGDTSPNVILTVNGKTGIREVVASKAEVRDYFRAILKIRENELGKHPDLDSLVFCHKDGRGVGSFKKSFAALLKGAKVENDGFGKKRVSTIVREGRSRVWFLRIPNELGARRYFRFRPTTDISVLTAKRPFPLFRLPDADTKSCRSFTFRIVAFYGAKVRIPLDRAARPFDAGRLAFRSFRKETWAASRVH